MPYPDSLNPPCGISATSGMWALIHTQPNSSARDMRIAREWSVVNTLDASPYGVSLASSSASASSAKVCTVMIGPKISLRAISSSCCTPATTVGV